MTGRRFSLAIEDSDQSDSPESPSTKPFSAFLLDNRPQVSKARSSPTLGTEEQPLSYRRRYSVCDLNNFNDDDPTTPTLWSPYFSPSETSSKSTFPPLKNHRRRNSVAIKFSLPRAGGVSTS